VTVASTYAAFAAREARGTSGTYERLALAVSRDPTLIDLLEALPAAAQQPNLLFGAVRFLGGPVDDPLSFHDFTVANWATVSAHLLTRSVQTNEVGRCALLLPVLAALP